MKHTSKLLWAALILLVMYGCQENEIANLEDANISELNEAQVSLRSRSCASEEHTERLLQDPAYQKSRQGRLERFEEFMSKGYQKAQCSSPVLIPVAIHYQGVGSTDRSCLISLAQSQIDILNRDLAELYFMKVFLYLAFSTCQRPHHVG